MDQLSREAQLLLLRLLPAEKSKPGPKKLRDELSRLGAMMDSEAKWEALLSELRNARLLNEKSPIVLTDSGRAKALAILGLKELPAKTTWPQLRDRYLLGLAAGGANEELRTKDKLAACMLDRKLGLGLKPGATLSTAVISLVCKELGFPGLSDLESLQAAAICRFFGWPENLPLKTVRAQLVTAGLGAKNDKLADLRTALIAQWVKREGEASTRSGEASARKGNPPAWEGEAPAEPLSGAFDTQGSRAGTHPERLGGSLALPSSAHANLKDFAMIVEQAASRSATGRFGDNKVFINHVWRSLCASSNHSASPDLATFKQRLIEANREGLLKLSRADLVAAMDPRDVAESETTYLNTEFHFVLTEGRR